MSYRTMIFVFAAAFIAAFTHTAKAQVVSDGLVAYWSFDDIDGNTVKDGVGENHGEMINVNVVDGAIGDALEFDGTGQVDIGTAVTELGAADFTIAAWIKTASIGTAILCKGNGAGWSNLEKELYVAHSATSEGPNSGTVEYVCCNGAWIRGSMTVNDDIWHHIAVTWDMKANEGHVYVDGEEGTHAVDFSGGADNPNDTVRLGFAESEHTATNFKGLMDDVRIYDRALKVNELEKIMRETTAVSPAGKLAITWGMIK